VCIIPRIGKNARGKKENSPENLTLMVPSRVSHRAIDPGTPIIFILSKIKIKFLGSSGTPKIIQGLLK
jgi:hypothetical protein